MNRNQRRASGRYDVRCPRDRKHRVLVHVNSTDATKAVWHCMKCETVGAVAIDSNARLHAIHPEPMTDYDRMAWAQLIAGLLAESAA